MLMKISACLAAALLVGVGPEATSARLLAQACGMGGQPVCSGAAMNGRTFECDFGYHGQNGVCVKYSVVAHSMGPAADAPCGKLNLPKCKGAQMAGRRTECDYGFMADGDMCVEWTADGVPSAKAVATAASTTANNTVAAKAATSDCGTKNKPICKGADMNGRDYECDFGLIGLCTRVTATTRDKICVTFHDNLIEFDEENIAQAECSDL